MERFHYSHRWPANVQLIGTLHIDGGLFGTMGEALAAAVFSIPPTRWREDVIELSRLVRHECARVPLTLLMRLALRRLRKADHDLVVSYADATQSHHGGVYQAAGWRYDGKRGDRMDGLIVNGKFKPGRTCNSLWGTQSPARLRELNPEWSIEPHYDRGKHLYWMPLSRAGQAKAERLGLKSMGYPKPNATQET